MAVGMAEKMERDKAAAGEARRRAAEEKLAAHIREVVDAAPPLTHEQRDTLAALLRPYAL